jgi:hypothetical protein
MNLDDTAIVTALIAAGATLAGIIIGKWGDIIVAAMRGENGHNTERRAGTRLMMQQVMEAHERDCRHAVTISANRQNISALYTNMADKGDIETLSRGQDALTRAIESLAVKVDKHTDWHLGQKQ